MGTPMPAFTLPDAIGGRHAHHACVGSEGTLVIFMCNHCPFVIHAATVLAELAAAYCPRGIGFVGINSNDADAYPKDSAPNMVKFSARYGLEFPYLRDVSQAVARDFKAACTPDFFLYGKYGTLMYHGQLDDSRPDSGNNATGCDIQAAMDAILSGGTIISDEQVQSIGCNIKWKAAD